MGKKIVGMLFLTLIAAAFGVERLSADSTSAQQAFNKELGVSVPQIRSAVAAPKTVAGALVAERTQTGSGWIQKARWDGGWGRDRDRGRWGQDCRAYDNGWEEHWGGHRSCSECQKPSGPHGRCYVRCFEDAYRCVSEWQPDDVNGRREEYRGRERDRQSDAEDSAIEECRWENRHGQGRCRIKDCERTQRETSGGSC